MSEVVNNITVYRFPPQEIPFDVYVKAKNNLGLGNPGRRTIDDYFNPFYYTDTTRETFNEPSRGMLYAKELFYSGDIADLVIEACKNDNCNNPRGYHGDDPVAMLSNGEDKMELAFLLTRKSSFGFHIFLETVGADPYRNEWNYEPNWLYALMVENPNSLIEAYSIFIDRYKTNPESLIVIENIGYIEPED